MKLALDLLSSWCVVVVICLVIGLACSGKPGQPVVTPDQFSDLQEQVTQLQERLAVEHELIANLHVVVTNIKADLEQLRIEVKANNHLELLTNLQTAIQQLSAQHIDFDKRIHTMECEKIDRSDTVSWVARIDTLEQWARLVVDWLNTHRHPHKHSWLCVTKKVR